jgi:hypothetical protein
LHTHTHTHTTVPFLPPFFYLNRLPFVFILEADSLPPPSVCACATAEREKERRFWPRLVLHRPSLCLLLSMSCLALPPPPPIQIGSSPPLFPLTHRFLRTCNPIFVLCGVAFDMPHTRFAPPPRLTLGLLHGAQCVCARGAHAHALLFSARVVVCMLDAATIS